jgi:hypothetical protein
MPYTTQGAFSDVTDRTSPGGAKEVNAAVFNAFDAGLVEHESRIAARETEIDNARGGQANLDARLDAADTTQAVTAAEVVAARDTRPNLHSRFNDLEAFNRQITNARYLLNFGGNKHATLSAPITVTAQSLIIIIRAAYLPDGTIRYLTDSSTGARMTIAKGVTDRFTYPTTNLVSATLDGQTVTTSTLVPTDGKIHTLRLEYSNATYRIDYFGRGQASASTGRWNSWLADIQVIANGVSYTFEMDNRTATTDTSLEANATITYSGVALTDWDEKSIDVAGNVNEPSIEGLVEIDNAYAREVSSSQYYVWQKLPDGSWLQFDMRRDTTVGVNVDVWRIYQVRKGTITGNSPLDSSTLGSPQDVTLQNSQWEHAIKPVGAPDLMGGFHGDEKLKSSGIIYLLNGKQGTLSGSVSAHDRFEMVQETEFFDPSSPSTKVADVYTRHIWDANGLTIDTTIAWVASLTIEVAYAGMLPLRSLNAVSTKARYLSRVTIYDVDDTVANFDVTSTKDFGAELWNGTNDTSSSVEVLPDWFNNFDGNARTFMKHVQNSNNKVYPTRVYTGANRNVVNGDAWHYTAKYKFLA